MSDQKKKISYLGIPGSYSHQACAEMFPGGYYRGLKKFDQVIYAADSGETDYAVLPVENSSAGRVTEVYNLLPSVRLKIIGEYLLPIHHSLMVSYKAYRQWVPPSIKDDKIQEWKNSPLSEDERAVAFRSIKEVVSHSQALMQCSQYLEKHLPSAKTIVDFDTATAAQALSWLETKERAVIASKHAAQIYNLMVMDENIENDPYNMTRFLVFGKEEIHQQSASEPFITSILFQTSHVPGSLIKVLQTFADHGINLTKLETYMVSQKLPNPTFYVDIGTSIDNPALKTALKEFSKYTAEYHILGSYPASPKRGDKNSFLPVM
ncbi:MAG: prephenate dehydratase [Alphaproteobacteria bacterium]|nr:prephenate dehydratase [Alphaproteobacteria bacterium]